MYIACGEQDSLRDVNLDMYHFLKENGVNAVYESGAGLMNGISGIPISNVPWNGFLQRIQGWEETAEMWEYKIGLCFC